jgi:hypothetical protein
VDGVGIVRYPDPMSGQLVPESYRSRASGRRRRRQRRDPLLQLLRPADQRLPDPLSTGRVEGGKNLAAAGVEDREAVPRNTALSHPPPDRIERADAGRRQAEAGAQPAGGGDADPQAGEGAGAEADREQVHPLPAAGCGGTALDLLEQRGRMPGPAVVGGTQQRLVEDLAVAPSAGGGVGGSGVEADDDQCSAASSS